MSSAEEDSYSSDENIQDEEEMVIESSVGSILKLQIEDIVKENTFDEDHFFLKNRKCFDSCGSSSYQELLEFLTKKLDTLKNIPVVLDMEKWNESENKPVGDVTPSTKKKRKRGSNVPPKEDVASNVFDARTFLLNYLGSDKQQDAEHILKQFKEVTLFTFQKPTDVVAMGSHIQNAISTTDLNVDIGVKMPVDMWKEKDLKGHRYYVKRMLYLAVLGQALKDIKGTTIKFAINSFEEYHIPRLELHFSSTPKLVVKIWPILDAQCFKWVKLTPSKFHMRYYNTMTADKSVKGEHDYYFPPQLSILDTWHNSDVSADLLKMITTLEIENAFRASTSLQHALICLKTWTKSRCLYKRMNGFLWSMLLVYLLQSNVIHKDMDTHGIFINTISYIASSAFLEHGFSLDPLDPIVYESCGITPFDVDKAELKKEWNEYSEIVFLDGSGFVNFAARMKKYHWNLLHEYAQDTLKSIEKEMVLPVFHKLFNPMTQFDLTFRMEIMEVENVFEKILPKNDEMNVGQSKNNNIPTISLDNMAMTYYHIADLLQKGWESRITSFNLVQPGSLTMNNFDMEKGYEWSLNDSIALNAESISAIVNVNVNVDTWKKMLEQGPPAQDPMVPSFIKFWGEKFSGLRRFKDGQILHCGVWGENDQKFSGNIYRHLILMNIAQYLLNRHLNIDNEEFELVTAFVDKNMVVDKKRKLHTIEVHDDINKHWNSLHSILHSLDVSIPLKETRAVGSSVIGTNPFPQQSNPILKNNFLISEPKYHRFQNMLPEHIDIVLQLESHTNWPDDYEAIKDVKTLFYFEMKKALLEQYNVRSKVTKQFLELYYSGYVWRAHIHYHREIELARRIYPNKATALANMFEDGTRLTSLLRSMYLQNTSFGLTCQLVKKWLGSQLIPLNHVHNGYLIDLIVAYIYLPNNEYYHAPPQHHFCGFLRVLEILSTFRWAESPLILNVENSFNNDVLRDITRVYEELDASKRPAVWVVFPDGQHHRGTSFTYPSLNENSLSVLDKAKKTILRLEAVAVQSKKLILSRLLKFDHEDKFKTAFVSDMNSFDVIIALKTNALNVGSKPTQGNVPNEIVEFLNTIDKTIHVPVLPGFDMTQLFVHELEEQFGDKCIFFYDLKVSNLIGMIWKPSVFFVSGGLRLNSVNCLMPVNRETKSKPGALPNIFQILSNIRKTGEGVIDNIRFVTGSHKIK